MAKDSHGPSGEWNPRYLVYAKCQGVPDPDAMLAKDEERYPGGKMCGFILWIDAKWSEWATVTGHPRSKDRNAPIWPDDHVVFDAWLAESM